VKHWLLKTEPSTFGIEHLQAAAHKTTSWEGVRNYQARNLIRDQIQKGDHAFLYHSSCEQPGIVGTVRVVRAGYPDKSAFDRADPPLRRGQQRRGSALVYLRCEARAPLQTCDRSR
jgi:predicted RNA-binding protein with PUA-like domain